MSELLLVGDFNIEVVKKNIKNIHLSVHPPKGVVKVDNKTWNSFKKGENMNPSIISRKVKQLNLRWAE